MIDVDLVTVRQLGENILDEARLTDYRGDYTGDPWGALEKLLQYVVICMAGQ